MSYPGEFLDPTKEKPEWSDCNTMYDLVQHSRSMLHLHRFLSMAENEKVLARIRNWEAKEKLKSLSEEDE